MNSVYYAQFFILLAFITLVFACFKKEESSILIFQIMTCFFFAIGFGFLGAYTGVLINVLGIIRNIVYYKFEQENNLSLLLVFIMLGFIVTCNSYDGFFSLFPFIAFSCYSFLLWKNDYKIYIYGNIISSLFWLLYNIFVLAYLGIIGETIIIISCLYIAIKKRFKFN